MRKIFVLAGALFCVFTFVNCKVKKDNIIESGQDFGKGDGQKQAVSSAIVKTEMICLNPPTPELHSSTIEESSNGLVAAWFGGTKEKNPDVGIWVSREENGKWLPAVEVVTGMTDLPDGTKVQYPCWNPVLYQVPNGGPLMLFYKVGPTTPQWWGMLMRSTDGGRTWTKPERLPKGIYGPIKNKPIRIGDNGILSPSSIQSKVHFERSDDMGKTWTRTAAVTDNKTHPVIQPSLLIHSGNRLQAIGRPLKDKRMFSIWSQDGGATWGQLSLLNLPNPNSGTDAVTLKDGRHLLVYNHSDTLRSPLNVAISEDGENWYPLLVLENDAVGGYSYPAMIQTKDGMVHITYSWKRKNIKHIVLDPSKLKGKPLVSWNFEAEGIKGTEETSKSTFNANGIEQSILSRGLGIKAQKSTNSFASAFPVNEDANAAIAAGAYYQFTVKAKEGSVMSLSSIGAVLRVQTEAPKNYQWKYSLDEGKSFKDITSPVTVTSGFTINDGLQQPQQELWSISELQNIASSKKVIFRLYAWGGTNAAANNGFRIGKSNAFTPALIVNGTVDHKLKN
jgi:predicted neuraminidase